jgi:hypothetical protein
MNFDPFLAWLLKALNISDEVIDHISDCRLAVHHERLLIVGLALLLPWSLYVAWRQARSLADASLGLRFCLSTIRIAMGLFLILVLADPYLRLDYQIEKRPLVAVLLDSSASMQLPVGEFANPQETARQARAAGDKSSDPRQVVRTSRWTHAANALRYLSPSLCKELSQRAAVRYFCFDRELVLLGIDPANPQFPGSAKPRGASSRLGDAVIQVLADAGDRPIAGIILLSDGESTAGMPLDDAARSAGARSIPIYTVPIGSSARLRDVAVTELFATDTVSIGDQVKATASIESDGFDKRQVQVELLDGDKIVDSQLITLQGGEPQQIDLNFRASEPGNHWLTARIAPQVEESEALQANNSSAACVRVSDSKLRVLYLEGWPRWDFRFLKNAMRRDHGLGGKRSGQPDIILEREYRLWDRKQQSAALPSGPQELAQYDVVILGDVSPALLTPAFLQSLDEAVRHQGVGLIVAAGPLYMPHAYGEPLRSLLPVRLAEQAAGYDAPGARAFSLELSAEGTLWDAMRFADRPAENLLIWKSLPTYEWCWPACSPAPGASVLVWNPGMKTEIGKLPLIATHCAAKGRVLGVGTDSTWLWRRNVGDRYFYKFWGQSIRAVARRQAALADSLEALPRRCTPGESVHIQLSAFSADGRPKADARVAVQVSGPTNGKVEMQADPGAPGIYRGVFTTTQPGQYRLAYQGQDGRAPAETVVRADASTEEFRRLNFRKFFGRLSSEIQVVFQLVG